MISRVYGRVFVRVQAPKHGPESGMAQGRQWICAWAVQRGVGFLV